MMRYFPSMPDLLRFFIKNRYWILSYAFSASVEVIIWFFSFILLMQCIIFIDLCLLNNFCILVINPTRCAAEFSLLVFYWEFLYLYSSEILAFTFLAVTYLWAPKFLVCSPKLLTLAILEIQCISSTMWPLKSLFSF